jgi:ADP-dependent NAD(P)H-hydrate dehydratase / NAD(P)H-hydrate epimerase
MKALTASEMREVDRLTTERYGISQLQLMESAGRGVAGAAWGVVAGREDARICVLCGKGNNGGDGFVAARYLKQGKYPVSTRVVLFGRPEDVQGDAAANLARWRDAGNPIDLVNDPSDWSRLWPEVRSSTVIVDALVGTGLRGAPTGLIAQAISEVNQLSCNSTAPRPALILAVDTPSGLASDGEPSPGPVLCAHRTVTFTAPKIGQLISQQANTCGALEVVAIGSPASLVEEVGKSGIHWIDPTEFSLLPLVRPWNSHKGRHGHVLLVAGSTGKSGAAILAGLGALRAGAGLVTIAAPESVQPVIASAHSEYMTEALETTANGAISPNNLRSGNFARITEGKTILAIGPGLGQSPESQEFVTSLVRESPLPLILDADALNAFAGRAHLLGDRKSPFLALTPHPGEMARLLGITAAEVEADRVLHACAAAKNWNANVVLKGFHTLVAAPDGQLFVNTSGNPGLAKGGSGDVLTGVVSALVAQFPEDKLRALALSVYLHGLAADLLAEEDQDVSGILASEVAQQIPAARNLLLRELRFRA